MLNSIRKLSNIGLLDEIKTDAMSNLTYFYSFSFIDCILDFAKSAHKKGMAGLLSEIKKYPKDIPLFADMIEYTVFVMTGLEGEELLKILADDYWRQRKRGNKADEENAFVRFVTIISIFYMMERKEPQELQPVIIKAVYELFEKDAGGELCLISIS